MPLVNVKPIKGVFTPGQDQRTGIVGSATAASRQNRYPRTISTSRDRESSARTGRSCSTRFTETALHSSW